MNKMKKTTFILLAMVMSLGCLMAQNANNTKQPKAEFKSLIHNFGKVAEEVGTVTTEFEFTNTGSAPLVIQDVRVTCGCTTPAYTREPVLPGKKGVIKVSYSTVGRIGAIDKKITVFTNVPDAVYTLAIAGEVLPRK